MEYQDKFEINKTNGAYFGSKVDILILGGARIENDRNCQSTSLFADGFKGIIIYFETNKEQNNFSMTLVNKENTIIEKLDNKLITPGLRRFFKQHFIFNQYKIYNSNICIDITSLPHILIFSLFKVFVKEIKPKNLFAAYTEPDSYIKLNSERNNSCIDDEEFDLYEEILGLNYSIEGFSKIKRVADDLLIASLGFERQRLLALFEKVEPRGGLIPIIGFPSFKPGWNITALNMNYKVIEDANSEGYIETCESSSPFEIYSRLKSIYNQKSDNYNIMIAPFGTRPNCLGATIFALRHKGCQLVFDFPVEKNYRSNGLSKTYFYILSSFLIE